MSEQERRALPEEWRWGRLGEALSIRKEFITIDDSAEYTRVTVQLHGRGIIIRDKVLGESITTKQQQPIKAGDLLVAEIDAKVGGFGIVPQHLDGALVSSHYFTFEIDQDLVSKEFLELMIRVGFITNEILQFVRGSLNYAAIRPRHVENISFPFACPKDQEKLANYIKKVDQARASLNAQLKALDAMPAALLSKAFNGEL